jgi:long-chain-fatty-acid--CoA ligase ACSBG
MASATTISLLGAKQLAHRAHPIHAGKGVYWTDDPSVELPIRLGSSPPANAQPVTLVDAITASVEKHASRPALRVKRGGKWLEWTYSEYFETSKRAGRALLHPAIGLMRFQGVGILAFNSPEWACIALGCIFAGGLHAGIYTTNTADAVHYVLDHCDAGQYAG